MPGTLTADDDANLPEFIRAAIGADRSWVPRSLCVKLGLAETEMFRVSETDHIREGGKRNGRILVHGEDRVAHAELICQACPVQWECALYGIQIRATTCVYGLRISRLKKIAAGDISKAKVDGVTLNDAFPLG